MRCLSRTPTLQLPATHRVLHSHHVILLARVCVCVCRLSDKEAKFVKAGSTDSKELIDTLATFEEAESRFFGVSPPKFFSINDEADVGKGRNVEGVQYAYETFLPARFPTPSQWEKGVC